MWIGTGNTKPLSDSLSNKDLVNVMPAVLPKIGGTKNALLNLKKKGYDTNIQVE